MTSERKKKRARKQRELAALILAGTDAQLQLKSARWLRASPGSLDGAQDAADNAQLLPRERQDRKSSNRC
jgi:hypothetical protein